MIRFFVLLFSGFLLAACVDPQAPAAPSVSRVSGKSVLVMGDSMFAVNRVLGASVAEALAAQTGAKVTDHSLVGAKHFYLLPISGAAGMRISSQYRPGQWDWVVLNGGGNDILFGCGCGKCDGQVDRLISADGRSGAIPELVARIRADGARVVMAGYLRTPGVISPVEACGPIGDEMDRRLARTAAAMEGVWFLPMSDLVPMGDRSFHGLDLVHPSAKGSRAIAARIAAVIKAH